MGIATLQKNDISIRVGMAQANAPEEERRQIAEYSCSSTAPLDFTQSELAWLEHQDIYFLRHVWGYRCDTDGINYEDETHRPEAGYRALQEYTDLLFRTLAQLEDAGMQAMMSNDVRTKLANQSGHPFEARASEDAKVNIAALLRRYVSEDGVGEALGLLAQQSLVGTSLAFACFIYSARQMLRMVELPEVFRGVDELGEMWHQKVMSLSV